MSRPWQITYYNIELWVYIHHSTCKREAAHKQTQFKRSLLINGKSTRVSFQPAHIPLSSTTGSADTRCSTKIPSAVYSGVSARTTAMFWNVPIFSSSMVCFKNDGFGISAIWKQKQEIVPARLKTVCKYIKYDVSCNCSYFVVDVCSDSNTDKTLTDHFKYLM